MVICADNQCNFLLWEGNEWLKRLMLIISLGLYGSTGLVVAQRPTIDYWNIPTLQITPLGFPFRYQMPDNTFHAMPNSTLSAFDIPTGLKFSTDGQSGLSFTDYSINGTPTAAGQFQQVRVEVTTPYGESLGTNIPIEVVETPKIPAQQAIAGTSFSYTIPVNVFPNYNLDDRPDDFYRLELGRLPAGLTQVNRSIAGSANEPGVFMVQATLYNGTGTDVAIYFPLTINSANPLPVQFVSFSGQWRSGMGNQLRWVTSWEKDNDHFEIQAGTDAQSFERIGQVEAQGHSATTQEYMFVDINPQAKITYYRLKQIDQNGRLSYSKIIAVEQGVLTSIISLILYPNPASALLEVQLNAGQQVSSVRIFNTQGQRVLESVDDSSKLVVAALSSGVYMVEVKTISGHLLRQRFVKQ